MSDRWHRWRLTRGGRLLTAPHRHLRKAERTPAAKRRPATRAYEAAVALPFIAWTAYAAIQRPHEFQDPMLLLWAVSIAVADLLPVPTSIDLRFSLSFPLQLAVALIYAPPIAAAVAFAGTSDDRELRLQLPPLKSLFIRAQIALSVAVESTFFHEVASLHSSWYLLGVGVLGSTMLGYGLNALLVAWYFHLESGRGLSATLRQMHVGIFGEFVVSYMGLALFGVLVATTFVRVGIWSIAVFIAPLAFARQMFFRTHSLQRATEELEVRQQEQEHQATHDALTGLPNRSMFMQRFQEAIHDAAADGTEVAVMIMDLDDFKEINDTLGHHYGDLLLQETGARLLRTMRDGDLMARLGGDEFGILVPRLPNERVAVAIAERLLEALAHPLALEGLALDVSASIGVAIYPGDSRDAEALLRCADVAMYAAKEAHSGFEMYAPSRDRYTPARLTLLTQIRPAIESEAFVLHYQPKLELASGRVTGVEALVRWRHPEHGLLLPDEFLPLVERTVLLRPLTMHVLKEALRQWSAWARQGLDVDMAVNLSARNLVDVQLPDQVGELLARWAVPPDRLVLELTESTLMADSVRSIGVLDRLSAVGVKLSIDDFGTGYSSLSYLKRLPIDEIKVDRSFVTNMLRDPGDAMIVRATVDLGKNLGLRVVAEGVEDEATWDRLAELGCDLAQGFLMAEPLSPVELMGWLDGRMGLPPAAEAGVRPVRIEPPMRSAAAVRARLRAL